jgi:hypothetical protein
VSEILRFLGVAAGLCALSVAFPAQGSGKEGSPGKLVMRYNASGQGRRLAQSLRISGIRVSAWQWRRQQLVVFIAIGAAILLLGLGLLGWGLALTAVRFGFALRKKVARRVYRASFRPTAISLCAALAAELSMQVGLAEAIRRALQSRPGDRSLAFDILSRSGVLMRAGAQPEPALRKSVTWWTGEISGSLASLLALLEGGDGSVRVRSLERLAGGLDADERNAGEVAGALTEARFVAFAIPVLAGLFAAGLVVANPASAAVLNSMFGVIVCALCAGVACGGVLAVRRLTSQ